jgi:uncharacterized protein
MEIQLEHTRVVAKKDGKELGEMTFVDSGNFYIIDHTGVEDEARGLGVGKELVAYFVAHAKRQEKKVLPLCPFAKAEFEKNKEYQTIQHGK